MSVTLQAGGSQIDRASQIILEGLKGSGWMLAKPLANLAELDQNVQVFYRIDEYLKPAGLVEEADREDRPPGYEEPRQFRLTDAGQLWVEGHAQDIATPATRVETQQMAREAHDAAETAKNSVQNYRKKLHRLKGRVEELEELPERVRETETKLEYQAGSLQGIRSRGSETQEAHEEFVEEMRDVIESQRGEIERLGEENVWLRKYSERIERKLDGVVRQQAERERDHAQSGWF